MEVSGELKLLEGAVLGVRQKLPLPPPTSRLTIEVFSLHKQSELILIMFVKASKTSCTYLRGEKRLSVDSFLDSGPLAVGSRLGLRHAPPVKAGEDPLRGENKLLTLSLLLLLITVPLFAS